MRCVAFSSLFFILATVRAFSQQSIWNIDPAHTKIQFIVSHLGISEVEGRFTDFSGSVKTEKEDFSDAAIEFTLHSKSIDTDNNKRDDHLKSEAFLFVDKYPEINFLSTGMKVSGIDQYKLTGQLTIRGITHNEEFDVKYQGTVTAMGKTRAGFKLTGTIDRFDYNVNWNKTFSSGLIVGKEVNILCNVEIVKQ